MVFSLFVVCMYLSGMWSKRLTFPNGWDSRRKLGFFLSPLYIYVYRPTQQRLSDKLRYISERGKEYLGENERILLFLAIATASRGYQVHD